MNTNEKLSTQQRIERYRNRQANARLESMVKRTGRECVLVNLPNGCLATVEVSTQSLTEALKYFESIVYGEFSQAEAETLILTLYTSNLSKHGDRLTESGNAFMNDLIKQTVMMVVESPMPNDEPTVH